MVGLDLVDGVELGNGGGGVVIKGQFLLLVLFYYQFDNGVCLGQMLEFGRVRWVIEGRGGGIFKVLFLGFRIQLVVLLELEELVGGGGCQGWGRLVLFLIRGSYRSLGIRQVVIGEELVIKVYFLGFKKVFKFI